MSELLMFARLGESYQDLPARWSPDHGGVSNLTCGNETMQQRSRWVLLAIMFVASLAGTSNAATLKKGKSYLVVTTEGKVYRGTLVKETATSVVLKTAKKKIFTIRKVDIEAIREAGTPHRRLTVGGHSCESTLLFTADRPDCAESYRNFCGKFPNRIG